MTVKRIVTLAMAFVAVGLALAAVWVRVGTRARPKLHSVVLANGETVSGYVLPLSDALFVLQSEDRSWIVGTRDILEVDGSPVSLPVPVDENVVLAYETFEDILPSGEIEVHSSIRHRNGGTAPLRELRWGMASHEEDYIESFRMLDAFGNSMPLEIEEERADGSKRVKVTLVRPLFPGEQTWYTSRFRERNGTGRDGAEFVYRHVGDYPEQRLVTRSVLLPAGADVVSITPEPLHRETVGGRVLVVWRRFFLRGDQVPWEIRYRL